MGVVVDGIAVALGADLIFLSSLSGNDSAECVGYSFTNQHLLVDTVVIVGVEVVAIEVVLSVLDSARRL